MSSVGAFNLAALGSAMAAAGSVRNPADADRVQANQAYQKHQCDEVELANRDIAERDESEGQVTDREADGRLPWHLPQRPKQDEEDKPDGSPPPGRSDDTDHQLDLCV